MKWKCTKCSYGPCVYRTAGYSKMLMDTRCFNDMDMENTKANWRPMSEEEPERKGKIGLPNWLRVGNFVVFDKNRKVLRIEGYDVNKHTISVASRNLWGKMDRNDVHCGAFWGEARVVFPRPYTFETAPEIIKVRHKNHTVSDVLIIVFDPEGAGYTSVRNPNHPFISFEKALKDYEQLDGWPCGTFDKEE